MNYRISLDRDSDARVWIATSKDVPGLVLESGSYDALIERVRYAVPDLIELNRSNISVCDLVFSSERHDRAALNG